MKALDDILMTLESGGFPTMQGLEDLVAELGGDRQALELMDQYGENAPALQLLYINCLAVRKLRLEAVEG